MNKFAHFLKKAFTPVTVMLIPHSNSRSLNFKIPSIGIILSVLLWLTGSIYVLSIAVNTVEYRMMKEKLGYYSGQFREMKSTLAYLKKTESEFRKLFALGSRERVIENFQATDSGSIDMDALKGQIRNTVETVKDIREYLHQQRDIYLATPRGWPVAGKITSPYGLRENPVHGGSDFHSGTDIAVAVGTPIRATADGIVSFSGWSEGNGNLVVLEHGLGYSTLYAHNKTNSVKVGLHVSRGDIIAQAGSTGNSTGPHSHYEIWKNGRHINPLPFLARSK